MEIPLLRAGFQRAIARCHDPARRRVECLISRRHYATPADVEPQGDIRAAPPIRFSSNRNQFAQYSNDETDLEHDAEEEEHDSEGGNVDYRRLLKRVRIVPASPSYFTATPQYTDDFLHLSDLLRKYQALPVLSQNEAPRVAWRSHESYKAGLAEPVKLKRYGLLVEMLKRLSLIHPSVIPVEVNLALEKFKRDVQPQPNEAKPIVVDHDGKARAVGRRKSSSAVCFVVEGDGQCMVNGRTLTEYFARVHDRESALWALKATERIDKYNVWVVVRGGGTTGQAEAIMLGVAKALLAHEEDLKPALRKAGCITRDPRRVERKKPGKLKARKMPAWNRR